MYNFKTTSLYLLFIVLISGFKLSAQNPEDLHQKGVQFSHKDEVRIEKEKLESMSTDETDIREIKTSIEGWNKAYESKDADGYCSYLSDHFIKKMGGMKRVKEILENNYFSKWKVITLTSEKKSIEKTGDNYVVDEEVSFTYTDWNDREKNVDGVHRFLTFTKEGGKWKILSLQNQMLPAVYRKLNKNYPDMGKPGLLYVSHITKNFVSVINSKTDSLIGIIPADYGTCCIAFSKERGYIANFNSDNITVFDKKTNTPIATVPAGVHPSKLLITDNGKFILITHESNDGLWVMKTDDNKVINKIPGIHGSMVRNMVNNKIYVSSIFQPYIYVIDQGNQNVVKKITVGGRPLDIAITPNGQFLYVANFGLNEVEKISTQTDSIEKRIPNIDSARGIAVTKEGNYAYITNVAAGKVYVIDLKKGAEIKTVEVGRMPTSICMDGSKNCAYVSNQGESSISVINIKKNLVIKTISVADNPVRIQMP